MDDKESINKGLKFLRSFPDLANKELYQRAVLRFCDLVDEYVNGPKIEKVDFKDETQEDMAERIMGK